MKKLIASMALATTIGTANAMPSYVGPSNPIPQPSQYDVGFRHGKNHAYNNVAKTVVISGAVIMAAVVIYQLGKESNSRWGFNDEGQVAYRF